MRSLGILILLGACAAPEEWRRPYDGYLHEMARVTVLQVLDRETGDPVSGARVRQHDEHRVSGRGEWAEAICEKRTDEFGLVWFELPEEIGLYHWSVHADGYAPAHELGFKIDETVSLERGETFRGRLLDPFGKPIAGALVEQIPGCPHSPALASARTDADGVFAIHAQEACDWASFHPRFQAMYVRAASGDVPIPVSVAYPSRPIEGRVLWADGSAPQPAFVVNHASPRGAIAPVGPTGQFRIEGGDPRGKLIVYFPEDWVEIPARSYRRGGPFLHRIAAQEEACRFGMTITAEKNVPLIFERVADGRSWSGRTNQRHFLPFGEYRIQAGGAFSRYVGEIARQKSGAEEPVAIPLREQPRLRIDWGDFDPVDQPLRLHLAGRHLEWTHDGKPRYLPAEGRAVLYVDADGAQGFFEVGPARDGVRTVSVRLPGVKRLRVPGIEGGNFELFSADPNRGGYARAVDGMLETRATGPVLIEWGDESTIRRFHFDLPEKGGVFDPASVETHALPPPRTLRLQPGVGEASVEISPGSVDPAWRGSAESWLEVGADGVVSSPWFRDGARVRVYPEGNHVPRRVVLRGDGPYEVRWGDADIRLPDTEHRVYLNGHMYYHQDDPVLRGLDPGPHTLILGRPGKRHVVQRIVLKPGEERLIQPIE